MLIVLTGLQPTLWFADACGSDVSSYRRFVFARVNHSGRELVCAMCTITNQSHPSYRESLRVTPAYYVRQLGFGIVPVEYHRTIQGLRFATIEEARAHAVNVAWAMLARAESRALMLHVADMYNVDHYRNWEPVCSLK